MQLWTVRTVLQGEQCSACPSLGEIPANLNPGIQAQTPQQKGEKGEPGIGQRGEQVRLDKAIRSAVHCVEILSTFFCSSGGAGDGRISRGWWAKSELHEKETGTSVGGLCGRPEDLLSGMHSGACNTLLRTVITAAH